MSTSRKERITKIITEALNPELLYVENESPNHLVPENSETHFKLTVVSSKFDNLSKVRQHQLIYSLLADELQSGLHAISIYPFTPIKWEACQAKTHESPVCQRKINKNLQDEGN